MKENSITRRGALSALAAASALSLVPAAGAKEFPLVPTDWDAKGFYDKLLKEGDGFSYPGDPDRKQAVLVVDTQCRWCMRLLEELEPIFRQVDVRIYPIAALNPHSEAQGAIILSSEDPVAKLREQHDLFGTKGVKGIQYDPTKVTYEQRNRVWTNTKIWRRASSRVVPFGCFRNSKGEYVAFYSKMSKWQLADLFEINIEDDVRKKPVKLAGSTAQTPKTAAKAPAAASKANRGSFLDGGCRKDAGAC